MHKNSNHIKNRKALLMGSIELTPGLSLFKLAINAGLPYVTAHRYMIRLEKDGAIEIKRSGSGSQLKIIPIGRAANNGQH